VQHAATRRCAPVDAAHAIARRPLANVRELDPLGFRARGLVADEGLSLERCEDRAQRLDARIDLQRPRCADLRLMRVVTAAERALRSE